ncbi:MAG: sugar transporter [Prevotella sp.]|nr:sugar transporter [Prevotella sp.]
MNKESRVKKSILNAKINLLCYFVYLILSFFSRKTFLDCLGADFIGLTGTLSSILGMLSISEMGVGVAIAYNLYKPLEEGNQDRIEELVSVFGYLYRKIGVFILIAAIIISCFIPIVFKNTVFSLSLIYFAFYSILLSSLFSYFINYRQIILSADQRDYIVTAYLRGAMFIKLLVQMAVAYYWGNYYIWISLEIVYGVLSCIVLNWKIRKVYPWLNASVSKGKVYFPQNKHILTFTKQIFVHKIKGFILNQSDQILVFAFVSLKMVAFYGNYTLVISKVSDTFAAALNSFNAGVGNLVAEGKRDQIINVFWELVSLRFIIAGFIVFSTYNLIEPFIILWLGSQYVLDRNILILLMINVFIMQTRGAVDMFNNAYGHYADTWSAWAEGILNIGVTIATAPFLGIIGILLGKIVSLFFIVFLWKPYYLFHDGFKIKIVNYWREMSKYYLISVIIIVLGTLMFSLIPLDASLSFTMWILKAIVGIIPFMFIYISVLLIFTPGSRIFFNRIITMVKNRSSYC